MKHGSEYEQLVTEHYRKQAESLGLSHLSTMPDEIIREREKEAFCRYIEKIGSLQPSDLCILDVGCGNGYLLSVLRNRFPAIQLTGIDYSAEMIELSKKRNIERCSLIMGDVRSLQFQSHSFDIVLSERCIINCMDVADQATALHELHRLVRGNGYCVLIEGFTDGFENMNRARVEMGLSAIDMPYHNLFFGKEWFLETISELFVIKEPSDFGDDTLPGYNFLSSHYFMSRVVHACLARRQDLRNTEFVKFFSFLPPVGNYAPVQLFVLQKI